MINALIQSRLSALKTEAEQRALVQRLMTVLGVTDPPEMKRIEWEGKPATMYSWGEIVLVGGVVSGAVKQPVIGVAPTKPKRPSLLAGLTPAQQEHIRAMIRKIRPILDATPRLSLETLTPEKQEEARYWIRRARIAFDPDCRVSDEEIKESVEALRADVGELGLPEGI